MTRLDRYWINQPSTAQILHKYHGTNVLAAMEDDPPTIYFLKGAVVSMLAPRAALSLGWLEKTDDRK